MRGRRLTDGEADDGRAPGLLHAHALERVVQRREDKLKREDNQAAGRKPGRVWFQALRGSGELAGWWHRTVPYPRAPVEPADLCWRRSRSVRSYRGSCSYRGPCGVEQDLGICEKGAGANVQQHNRGRRTASQERRSRRPQRGGLEAKRRVTRHEAEHCLRALGPVGDEVWVKCPVGGELVVFAL